MHNRVVINNNVYELNEEWSNILRTIAIFTVNIYNSEYHPCSKMRVYNSEIKENNNLIKNFIPCYRKSDNVIGLYDTVNGEFYTNEGSGTFLKGKDV